MPPMLKDLPDHHDADLVIKLYDLRRDPVMRDSRAAIGAEFWPRTADEAVAVLAHDHPLNAAYRQTSTYWEMVYGMAHHGIVHADYLMENSGEGLILFSRVEAYLAAIRQAGSSVAFQHAEWVASETAVGRRLMERFRALVRAAMEGR